MRKLLQRTLQEACQAVATKFLGRERAYLDSLQVESIEKSTLRLEPSEAAPSASAVERVRRCLEQEISALMKVKIFVQIRSYRPPLPPVEEPLVDSGNRTAYLLLHALAEGRAEGLNPVFLYGMSGTGKSHLLRWFQRQVQVAASFWQGLEFHAAIARSLRNRGLLLLRRSLLQAKLFIIDEVHRLRGKARTQKELAYLIDELRAREVQILLVGRHHPNQIHDVYRPLASRFLGGFTVEITAPSLENRMRFLQRIGVGSDPVAVQQLAAGSRSYSELLYLAERLRAPREEGGGPRLPTSIDRDFLVLAVLERVAECFGVATPDLTSLNGNRRLSLPRHVAVYVALKSGISAAEMSRRLGWRSPSSVSYALRRVTRRMAEDRGFRRLVERCL
ncbi:MAG: DnaA ATPase domain-containing protein [Planctomycetota bacterium]